MAKRARTKSTRKTVSSRVRSRRARQGWETRRRNERQRSRAAKRAIKKHKIKAPAQAESIVLPIRDYLITLEYRKFGRTRVVDFVSSTTSKEETLKEVFKREPWTRKIPWTKIKIHEGPIVSESHELLSRLETQPSKRRKTAKRKST